VPGLVGYHRRGVRVSYLLGDSSEANIDFDYLAFLREVIDCATVLVECEETMTATAHRKRVRELESNKVIASVEELGARATELVGPVAKEQTATPVGRCAASIVAAIKDAVDRETSQLKSALASERAAMDEKDQRLQSRAMEVLEKLLRAHDLPGAEFELEVSGAKATMRQRTGFGLQAVVSLDVPSSSMLAGDLRVDRIAEGVEVHTQEASGWLKKSDKLVALKLGRYHVAGVTVGTDVVVRLRGDTNAGGVTITAHRNGDITAEATDGGRELFVEDRDKTALRLLAARLEAAAQSLEENRTGLVAIEIDGKSISEHGHPRVLAERLIKAIAPTVKKIAQHSRSPGELVLRRPIGDNRREEIFMSTADLTKRFEHLTAESQSVFAALELSATERPRSPTSPLRSSSDRLPASRPPTQPPVQTVVQPPAPAAEAPFTARSDAPEATTPPTGDPKPSP
jgi:hypothetical protein